MSLCCEGNFLLSIRPASGSAPAEDEKEEESPSAYEWSDDVKGAKAVRVSNLFEKFQYNFKKKFGDRNSDVAFGTGWSLFVSLAGACWVVKNLVVCNHS